MDPNAHDAGPKRDGCDVPTAARHGLQQHASTPARGRVPTRLTTVMGVGRALLTTAGPGTSVEVLVDQFGWDATFQALALLRGTEAATAFGLAWEMLITGEIDRALREE